MVFAADKCGPGAYNLPLYLAFADPMYCAGLMLPQMIEGFRFHVIDMDNTAGDSVIELDAPADSYHIAALLRDNERFGIDRIISQTYGEVAVAISAQRLHAIAGKYTGKDDPVAIVRNQGIFPAPEEIISPFAKAHLVGGDARGSHVMPLMPVPLNTPVTGMYCLPIVSCTGFRSTKKAAFRSPLPISSTTPRGTRSAGARSARQSRCVAKAGLAPPCCLMPSLSTVASATPCQRC